MHQSFVEGLGCLPLRLCKIQTNKRMRDLTLLNNLSWCYIFHSTPVTNIFPALQKTEILPENPVSETRNHTLTCVHVYSRGISYVFPFIYHARFLGSVENRGRSPRFSTLPKCIYGTLFTLLNHSKRSVENNGFCQNQYQYWVFIYVPLHTLKEHPLWMMNIFGVLVYNPKNN